SVASLPPTEHERIVFYADIARVVPPSDYSYPLEVEKALIACVCAGDVKRLNRLLDEVFVNHEQEARMAAGMTQCLKFDMMGTLFRCVQDFNRDAAEDSGQSLDEMINDMFRLEEPERIYEAMRKAFTRLCDFAYANKRSHNDELRDRILSYMADNYTNPDMGLDMVARAFGIAPGYLSRFFKEQTGGNFVDHVNRLRIECAAQLLRTGELSHAEIAEACGLSGSQALNRLFNRILSVSPSTYRQMARQGRFESSV
nr:helix-turn-helix transcriptional regulator [Clostridia bacterium]